MRFGFGVVAVLLLIGTLLSLADPESDIVGRLATVTVVFILFIYVAVIISALKPGADGGLIPRRGGTPEDAQPVMRFVMTVEVADCDGYLERTLAEGGSVALPAEDMAGIGRLAYIKDPDGNVLGLLQSETPAD